MCAALPGSTFAAALTSSLKNDFEYLCDFDRLTEDLSGYEKDIILKLSTAVPDHSIEKVLELYDNSIRLSWLEHIELKYPVIRMIATGRFDEINHRL